MNWGRATYSITVPINCRSHHCAGIVVSVEAVLFEISGQNCENDDRHHAQEKYSGLEETVVDNG